MRLRRSHRAGYDRAGLNLRAAVRELEQTETMLSAAYRELPERSTLRASVSVALSVVANEIRNLQALAAEWEATRER